MISNSRPHRESIVDTIQNVSCIPRKFVPYANRHSIAKMLGNELLMDKTVHISDAESFREAHGIFYPLILSLRTLPIEQEVRDISKRSVSAGLQVYSLIADLIIDIVDKYHSLDQSLDQTDNQRIVELLKMLEELDNSHKCNCKSPSCENNCQCQMPDVSNLLDELIAEIASDKMNEVRQRLEMYEFLDGISPALTAHNPRILDEEIFQILNNYTQRLTSEQVFLEIIDRIGRGIHTQSYEDATSSCIGSEVKSVAHSDDLMRILPSELVKLRHPLTRKLFFLQFVEKRLLVHSMDGTTSQQNPFLNEKGPVVALVDTSGSMAGDPEYIAKSIILEAAKMVLPQGRDVKVILFSGMDEQQEINLYAGSTTDQSAFCSFLRSSFGGGTDFDYAIECAVEGLKEPEFRDADILFITDGLGLISDSTMSKWQDYKKEMGSEIISILTIDSFSERYLKRYGGGSLIEFSDDAFCINEDLKVSRIGSIL